MQEVFADRRRVMCDALAKIPGLGCRVPEGAFYVLPDVSAYLGKSYRGRVVDTVSTLGEMLIEEAHAAVVPGDVFHASYAVRFSYACSEAHIRAGVGRVADFLAQLV